MELADRIGGNSTVKTLQTKLLLGLLPTLAILVVLGLWAIIMFYRLGGNIDVILRENYTSILAAEGMKEAIERMDSGLLFAVGGRDQHGRDQFDANRPRFLEHLKVEQANITLPGEGELADSVDRLFKRVRRARRSSSSRCRQQPPEHRAEVYFGSCCRPSTRSSKTPIEILVLNQDNMSAMDRRARANAATSIRLMIGALIARGRAGGRRRGAPEPVDLAADQHGDRRRAGAGAGELDQIVPAASRDELGELANAFNEMARTLREYRQAGTARLLRAQKTGAGHDRLVPRSGRRGRSRCGSVEQAEPSGPAAAGREPGGRIAGSLASGRSR